ncbi:MAG: efflux RND transporter permease subunit, partial [Planctomycetota bacterium]|nr:efflux RND transporter permease subunit [Planctomycetota bacterium]
MDTPNAFARMARRPVTLLVSFITLIVISLIAYGDIPLQLMPNGFVQQRLEVFIPNPGSSAEENLEKVTVHVEEQLRTLADVEEVYSRSSEGAVRITVTFRMGTDMDLAKAELRDRLERARPALPTSVERISIWAFDSMSMPVLWFAVLYEERSERSDYLIESVVQRRLEQVDGASRADIFGVLSEEVSVLLDEDKVKASRINLGAHIGRLASDNFSTPLGELTDGGQRFLLRSDMRFADLDDIATWPVARGLTLGDLGTVERTQRVRDQLSRIDGNWAYYGAVYKENSANLVETAQRVLAALDELETDHELEGEFKFLELFNQGKLVETSLGQLQQTALWGGGLAVLVLFAFLRRVRVTLCVALSIPVSALLSLAWVYFRGGTFNILTMTGITMAIGMLVDNAVVVVENITRLRATGRPMREASVAGAQEVGLAVAMATLTTVVVFLPLVFMTENPMLGMMFGEIAIPLCLALLFSLLVALVFLPVAISYLAQDFSQRFRGLGRILHHLLEYPSRLAGLLVAGSERLLLLLARTLHQLNGALVGFLKPIRWPCALALLALVAWKERTFLSVRPSFSGLLPSGNAPPSAALLNLVISGAWLVTVFIVAFLLIGLPHLHRRLPRPSCTASSSSRPFSDATGRVGVLAIIIDQNQRFLAWTLSHRMLASALGLLVMASVAVPFGSLNLSGFGQDEELASLEFHIDIEDNFSLPDVSDELRLYEQALSQYQEHYGFEHVGVRFSRSYGRVTLYWGERQTRAHLDALRVELRAGLPTLAGHQIRFFGDEAFDTRKKTILSFQLRGPDASQLAVVGKEAVARLATVPGLADVRSPLADSPERVLVKLDPERAHALGVSAQAAFQSVSWALRGTQLPRFQDQGRELPFLIEFDEEQTAGLDTLRDIDVWSARGAVPLSSFTDISFTRGPDEIQRLNGQTTFNIQARIDDPLRRKELSQAGYAALASLDFPRGVTTGSDDDEAARENSEMTEIYLSLALSVVLVFLLMGILFESVLLPFSILFTVPFAVVGAFWTLYLTGTAMDSVGWIGVLILVGVVVNNGIVLIDRIHRLRSAGHQRRQAVLDGAAQRVRPILMTALTTIVGLLPMALGEASSEALDYRALATCVAGGLAISTV